MSGNGTACAETLEKLLAVSENQTRYITLIVDKFRENVRQSEDAGKFWREFFSCSQNSERLNLVKKYFEWVPLNPIIKRKYKKSVRGSDTFRNLGNLAFHRKNFVEAARLYNMAAVFAIPDIRQPELALAYANRSNVLKFLGRPEEALQDIDLALASGYPNAPAMRKKMQDRKKHFETIILRRSEYASFEQKVIEEVQKRNKFYEDMFTLECPNPLAPALGSAVDIKWSAERGRYLVANRAIPMGTTVLVEKPFVAALEHSLNWEMDHCHHCLKQNFRCIPCLKCVFALYCNEKCRSEAQKWHQYECPCLPELHCILKDETGKSNFHLAFRLICLLGPHKLFKIFSHRKGNKTDFEHVQKGYGIAGCDPDTGVYESDSHFAIGNLLCTTTSHDGYYLLLIALTLSRTLDSSSDFFKSIDELTNDAEKSEFQNFIAELIVYHFEIFQRNTFGLSKITSMEGMSLRTYMESEVKGIEVEDYGFERFAFATYATVSLLNHSCSQNVIRFVGKTFGRMAIVALKSLKKGEELTISYGQFCCTPDEKDTGQRQMFLTDNYKFLCDCIACKYDWPRHSILKKRRPTFCCPVCASKFSHDSKMSEEFLKCILSGDFKCQRCHKQYSQQSIAEEFERRRLAFEMCVESGASNNNPSVENAVFLKSILQYFEDNVCPPAFQSFDGEHLYRDIVNLIIFFSDSSQ